jgi:hypothetical protein
MRGAKALHARSQQRGGHRAAAGHIKRLIVEPDLDGGVCHSGRERRKDSEKRFGSHIRTEFNVYQAWLSICPEARNRPPGNAASSSGIAPPATHGAIRSACAAARVTPL